jgi:poly(3-hydroxybutyrate) depolymerase
LCGNSRTILLAPRPASSDQWQKEDAEFVRKACDQVRQTYRIDPQRVVAFGEEFGGAVASFLAYQHRDLVRGVAVVNAPPGARPPENDPVDRLTFFVATNPGLPVEEASRAFVTRLREMKFSVSTSAVGGKHLGPDDLPELFRWIDSLDKI